MGLIRIYGFTSQPPGKGTAWDSLGNNYIAIPLYTDYYAFKGKWPLGRDKMLDLEQEQEQD